MESHFIPGDAWLVYKSDSTDRESFILSQLIDEATMKAAMDIIADLGVEEWLFYTCAEDDRFGLIAYGASSSIQSEVFTASHVSSQFTILSNYPVQLEEEHLKDELFLKAQKRSNNFCLLGTEGTLRKISSYFPASTVNILKTFIEDSWVTLNIKETTQLVQIDGVGLSKQDHSSKPSSSALLRYLPAQCNSALVMSLDSNMSVLIASIPDESTGNAFTALGASKFENRMEDEASYNGIQIGISSTTHIPMPLEFDWTDEAFYADLGSFFIFTETVDQIRSIIDDYVADDVLTRSIYFKTLESAITDAQFSFYVRPSAQSLENELVEVSDSDHGINSIVFQRHAEIPYQTFFNLAVSRNEELRDQCPILWSMYADSEITGGPWRFKNHYTNVEEIIIQDSQHQLYLINADGKTLWKKQLDEPVIEDIQQVDLYGNDKFQILFTTASYLMAVDRNGNNVSGFPIKMNNKATAAPALVRYEKNGDARIIVGDGPLIRNIGGNGEAVKGWKSPELSDQLELPIAYRSFDGKDYLIAFSRDHKLYFLDRRGKLRGRPQQIVEHLKEPEIYIGSSLSTSFISGYDSLGKIHLHQLNGDTSSSTILPVGTAVVANMIDVPSKSIAILNGDRIYYRDGDGSVKLDYLLPETMIADIHLVDRAKNWIAVSSEDGMNTYVIDLNGKMLDRMPVDGTGKPIMLDVDGNSVPELCVKSEGGEIVLYQLTN